MSCRPVTLVVNRCLSHRCVASSGERIFKIYIGWYLHPQVSDPRTVSAPTTMSVWELPWVGILTSLHVYSLFNFEWLSWVLSRVRFNVPLDTVRVISETIFLQVWWPNQQCSVKALKEDNNKHKKTQKIPYRNTMGWPGDGSHRGQGHLTRGWLPQRAGSPDQGMAPTEGRVTKSERQLGRHCITPTLNGNVF